MQPDPEEILLGHPVIPNCWNFQLWSKEDTSEISSSQKRSRNSLVTSKNWWLLDLWNYTSVLAKWVARCMWWIEVKKWHLSPMKLASIKLTLWIFIFFIIRLSTATKETPKRDFPCLVNTGTLRMIIFLASRYNEIVQSFIKQSTSQGFDHYFFIYQIAFVLSIKTWSWCILGVKLCFPSAKPICLQVFFATDMLICPVVSLVHKLCFHRSTACFAIISKQFLPIRWRWKLYPYNGISYLRSWLVRQSQEPKW